MGQLVVDARTLGLGRPRDLSETSRHAQGQKWHLGSPVKGLDQPAWVRGNRGTCSTHTEQAYPAEVLKNKMAPLLLTEVKAHSISNGQSPDLCQWINHQPPPAR